MKKLRKMTPEEYTIPTGNECSHASQLDVLNICMKHNLHYEHIELTRIEISERWMLLWFVHNSQDGNAAFFTLFNEDKIPENKTVKAHICPLEEGEYFRHKTDIYQLLSEPILGMVVRKVAVYASALEADIAYRLSHYGQTDDTPEIYPEFYLVRLTEKNKPGKTLCYAWYVEKKPTLFLQPIFYEDEEEFFATNRNNLNWEFLHEGDKFDHDNRCYQVCKDENDDYYIAPICPVPLQVIRCNL